MLLANIQYIDDFFMLLLNVDCTNQVFLNLRLV